MAVNNSEEKTAIDSLLSERRRKFALSFTRYLGVVAAISAVLMGVLWLFSRENTQFLVDAIVLLLPSGSGWIMKNCRDVISNRRYSNDNLFQPWGFSIFDA